MKFLGRANNFQFQKGEMCGYAVLIVDLVYIRSSHRRNNKQDCFKVDLPNFSSFPKTPISLQEELCERRGLTELIKATACAQKGSVSLMKIEQFYRIAYKGI